MFNLHHTVKGNPSFRFLFLMSAAQYSMFLKSTHVLVSGFIAFMQGQGSCFPFCSVFILS